MANLTRDHNLDSLLYCRAVGFRYIAIDGPWRGKIGARGTSRSARLDCLSVREDHENRFWQISTPTSLAPRCRRGSIC